MEYGLGGMLHSSDDVTKANDPQFRIFRVAHRHDGLIPCPIPPANGELGTPQSVGGMSAVAYYFCRELRSKLNRPRRLDPDDVERHARPIVGQRVRPAERSRPLRII